jgi:hypothetical protein
MNYEEKLELARGFVKEQLDRDIQYLDISEYLIDEADADVDVSNELTDEIYGLVVEEMARVVIAYQDLVALMTIKPKPADLLRSTQLRLEREYKKSAAANKECEALRREVRKLRMSNFILKSNAENTTEGNYRTRYEKLEESMQIIRAVLRESVNGIPEQPPKTLEPWLGPSWARKK